ncbi:unnamed protein product [Victoria cruziana]
MSEGRGWNHRGAYARRQRRESSTGRQGSPTKLLGAVLLSDSEAELKPDQREVHNLIRKSTTILWNCRNDDTEDQRTIVPPRF